MYNITSEYIIKGQSDLENLKKIFRDVTGEICISKGRELVQQISWRKNPMSNINFSNIEWATIKLRMVGVDSVKSVMEPIEKINEKANKTEHEWVNVMDNCLRSGMNRKDRMIHFSRPKRNIENMEEFKKICKISKHVTHILQISDTQILITNENCLFIPCIDIKENSMTELGLKFDLELGFISLLGMQPKLKQINEKFNKWKNDNYQNNLVNH